MQGGISNTITQGVAVATGLQHSFDWRGVAAGAIAGGVFAEVGNAIGQAQYGEQGWANLNGLPQGAKDAALWSDIGKTMARGAASGVAAGMASGLVRGGSLRNSFPGIMQDVIASTVGNAIGLGAQVTQTMAVEMTGARQLDDRSQYGGLRLSDVLGGEKNYLSMIGDFNSSETSNQSNGSWDMTVAAWRANNPTYQVLPQTHVFGRRETAEQQLNAAFGLSRKVTFLDANPSRIESQQSIWSSYSNIAGAYRTGQIGLGDTAAMAWDNTRFFYQGSPRLQGAVQVANGGLEVWGATLISGTGVGTVVGVPLAFHGGDNIGTGLSRVWTGNAQNTVTYIGVEALTGSRNVAAFVDNAIPFAGAVAGAGVLAGASSKTLTIASNPATGNPAAIARGMGELNSRQAAVLDQLPEFGSNTIVHKSFGQTDLAALTAATGDEFAMFSTGGRRLIYRGDFESVPITPEIAQGLAERGWRWSSHVHPGYDTGVLRSSIGDQSVLRAMGGNQSAIYNSMGQRSIFTPAGDSLNGWMPW